VAEPRTAAPRTAAITLMLRDGSTWTEQGLTDFIQYLNDLLNAEGLEVEAEAAAPDALRGALEWIADLPPHMSGHDAGELLNEAKAKARVALAAAPRATRSAAPLDVKRLADVLLNRFAVYQGARSTARFDAEAIAAAYNRSAPSSRVAEEGDK
jgi:hypothetical protein